ncbi:MAG: YggS family pyridoxal phosphate-dependent enzyme [Gemmatimonadetes bacterium]|nr:YggS family pyridoxal phosphate-dependent enzyme [Gemmatimonadota bacterium]
MSAIAENLKRVQDRIDSATRRSGRSADAVKLIVVTKTWPADVVQQVVDAGTRVLGESRVQEAQHKVPEVAGTVSWHLVGHLQRNKVKIALPLFDLIHSVDTLRLAKEISRWAVRRNTPARVLVQVNTSGEASKFGISPNAALDLVEQVDDLQGVSVAGLMTIGAFAPDPETARPNFVLLRQIRDHIAIHKPHVSALSMGMTGDFEVAIEEGATMVRVGTAIFGQRTV